MKTRVILFLKTYLLILCIFVLQKPLFMLYYHSLYADASVVEWLQVMRHGLPLDLSLAGYLTAIPGLLLIVSVWTRDAWLKQVWRGYFLFIAILLSLICLVDLGLYEYWGFRLDATPLFYFFSSPADAVASVSAWVVVAGIVGMLLYAALLFGLFRFLLALKVGHDMPYKRLTVSGGLFLLTALLFIPIRGGFTVSTMNTGKVYFSEELKLNHAATNPAFSLMESLSKQKDFAKQYRFHEADEANRIFAGMQDGEARGEASTALVDTLLNNQRPDVMFIILESFSSHLMRTLGGREDVAPCLDSLAEEGVLFTNFYANSFRTDRGLVSIMSGYPAQPNTSIMKYPRKTQHLPSICGSLKEAGYATHYYYGGDADFTNMRSYLMSSGFEQIVSDQDFPVSDRLSKWGVHDHLLFRRLLDDLKADSVPRNKPYYRVVQTSSSHEPFEVPYSKLQNERLNAFAYTDSVVGDFVRQFSKLPQWEHTLLVLVPDHMGCYPEGQSNLTFERYQIPMLFLGGAVREARKIDTCGSQHDLAATLLAQLGLPHDDFQFSKDMMNPESPHFAFFTVPDAWGMVTKEGRVIYDNQAGRVAVEAGASEALLPQGKAYLQKLYDDLAER